MPELSNKRPRSDGDNNEHSSPGAKRKAVRKRAALACEECRMRKRRCDGATPACGGCAKRMSTCIYSSDIQEKEWHIRTIQSLRSRLEELEQAERAELPPVALPQETNTTQRSSPNQLPTQDLATSDHDCGNRATSNSPISGDLAVASPPTHAEPEPAAHPSQSAGVLADSSQIYHHFHDVSYDDLPTAPTPSSVEKLMRPINQVINERSAPTSASALFAVSGGDDSGISSKINCDCDRIIASTEWSLPLRKHGDELVSLYFARVQRTYPILAERTFMSQYERLWKSNRTQSVSHCTGCPSLCRQKSKGKTFPSLIYVVFALASLFECGAPEQNSARAGAFFRQAQKIDLLDIIDEEVGIELVQLLLLMGFYLMSTERFSKCWNIAGLAIRMAQNMGLQLSPTEAQRRGLLAPPINQLDVELRIRVWYGCILLDREISMSFGRPLMIVMGGETLRLPESIDDDRLSQEDGKWNTQPANLPSLLESYIQTIKLYDILGRVLDREERKDSAFTRSCPATPSEIPPDPRFLLNLDTMIMEWRESLPDYLQHDPSSEGEPQGESTTPDGLVIPQMDFFAQAKRLHARFLHIPILILRPALEQLFDKQRHGQPSSTKPTVTKVQDLLLSQIAAQCALSADSLVRFLDAQIHSKTLVAWWYNVSYLHTCGSTLLMARLCNFADGSVEQGSLATSWELCVQCLSRYTGLSSIAQKSFFLLQESAKRLLSGRNLQSRPVQQATQTTSMPGGDSNAHAHDDFLDQVDTLCGNVVTGTVLGPRPPLHPEPSDVRPTHSLPSINVGNFTSGEFDDELWDGNVDSASWSFMPFLSQLETLPSDFDLSNI